jgi:beta-glucosidase
MSTNPYSRAILAASLAVLAPSIGPGVSSATDSLHPNLWPQGVHTRLLADTDTFVGALLERMTLEEKVGQMIQADIASITPDELRSYALGSVLAGGNAAPGNDVRCAPQAWLHLTDAYRRAMLSAPTANHVPIPILFGIDAVHGNAKLIGATIFPHNVGLGAAHDPDLVRRIGRATAEEVSAAGIDWTFAPTVAVARDVRWGRSYESYSESPELVSQYAPAMVEGLQGRVGTVDFLSPGHTLSSVKHFIGDGGTSNGRDQGNTEVSETELREVHAAGYLPAIEAGAMIVMASYNSWNGTKLHGDRYLLSDILKGRLGFDGFVVGDWNAHEEVPGCTKTDCAAAILAGVDMLMAPDSWKALYRNTLAEAESGRIPRARIDDAVRRILRVKAAAGLFGRAANQTASEDDLRRELGNPAHRAIAREAVRKSLVLLKNEHAILPLDPRSKLLVAGDAADDIGLQSGGWTIDWQGAHNRNADFPGATSIYAGIERAVRAAGGSVTLSRDGRFSRKPDAAIVVFGEAPYAEFEGDRETLEFSPGDAHELQLLRRLKSQGIPTIAVFLSGRPLWVNRELNASDAFVAAWLPGSEGEGVADVLLRAADGTVPFDFTGRLSFSWPATAMPVTFGAGGTVSGSLFARGAGLDYRTSGNVAHLSEESGVPPRWRTPDGSLLHSDHVIAPWSMFVEDEDAEVHVTTGRQRSPHGALGVVWGSEGVAAQWRGGEEGTVLISGRDVDLRSLASEGGVVTLRYRIDSAPERRVTIGMRCAEITCRSPGVGGLDLTAAFQSAPLHEWRTLEVPLACLAPEHDGLGDVDVPFALTTAGPFELTIAAIRLHSLRAGATRPARAGYHKGCRPS